MVYFSDAAPTATSFDPAYRFAVGVGVTLGLRHAPWWLLLASSVIVGLFVNSPIALVCILAATIFSTGGFITEVRALIQFAGKDNPAYLGVSDTKNQLGVVSLLTLALPDLTDRWTAFAASGAVCWVVLFAAVYLLNDLAPSIRFLAVGVAGTCVTGVAILGVIYGLEAQRQIADVEELRASIEAGNAPDIADVDSSLADLRSSLDRDLFRPLEGVPIVSQNVRSVRHLLGDADGLVAAAKALQESQSGTRTATSTRTIEGKSGGRVNAQVNGVAASLQGENTLVDLCQAVEDLEVSLQALSKENYLVPKFKNVVVELDSQISTVKEIDEYCPLAKEFEDVLGFNGKRTYLTLFMTTAEVRGIGGLITNWALLEFDQAQVNVLDSGRSVPMNDQMEDVGTTVSLPNDTSELWEVYQVEKFFQDIGVSPDAEIVSSTALQLFEQVYPDAETDGVMILGPKALAGLVATVGEVEVGDHTVDADNAVDFLTKEQYTLDITYGQRVKMLESMLNGVAGGGSKSAPAQPMLSLRLLDEAISAGEFMILPNDDEVREGLETIELTGLLPDASEQQLFGLIEQNFGLDKLDPYLERSAELVWKDWDDSDPILNVEYRNSATPDLPEYVLGIGNAGPAVNRLRVAPYAPSHAHSVTITAQDGEESYPPIFRGSENGNQVSVIIVSTPSEGSVSIEFEFEDWLPPKDGLRVLKPASINDRSLSIVVGEERWETTKTSRLSTLDLD